ncbi:MAG: hypothetical protein IIA02_00180 [Proteobacteria bacterium]|nr:hypothetical protein [Pseudomonadota bacterium]
MSTIRIEGPLREAGHVRMHGHGQFVVVLLIDQQGEPIYVEQSFGMGPSASFAASKAAAQLRAGTNVVAHGTGLTRGRLGNRWVLKLQGVRHVERPVAPSFHEPAAA